MKISSLVFALVATLSGSLAFNALAQDKKSVATGNAAVVNNHPISNQTLNEFMAALTAQGRPDTPELRKQALDDLVNREVFVQEAEKRGLAHNPDVLKQLDNVKRDLMIRALIRQQLLKNPVTDAEIKAAYDKVTHSAAAGAQKEYSVRHILVDKEDTAKGIIEQLKKGAKFEDLAKQSKDPGSAAHGGELGWNVPGTFVPEFSQAMVKLEKGKFTDTPVKTQFGYHVIRVDDVREAKPPALDQVKPQIQQRLEQERIQAYVAELRKKAEIK